MLLMKTSATSLLLKSTFIGMKYPNFKSLSTTTNIMENPCDADNWTMKSMAMSSQICYGIGSG